MPSSTHLGKRLLLVTKDRDPQVKAFSAFVYSTGRRRNLGSLECFLRCACHCLRACSSTARGALLGFHPEFLSGCTVSQPCWGLGLNPVELGAERSALFFAHAHCF